MKNILVVEDELEIRQLLANYLRNEGFSVSEAEDGVAAIELFGKEKFDLVILDILIPKIDGYGVCELIKSKSDVPVIFLSALGDERSMIKGYDSFADDYVTKPFSMPVFLRKVKAVLRRTDKRDAAPVASDNKDSSSDVITYPGFSVDKIRYVVSVDGNEIYMPPKELELLFFLASNPNRVFTREQLLENVWGYDFYGESRTVDVHIKRIREKIENPDREQNWSIKTVWSKGYKFETR